MERISKNYINMKSRSFSIRLQCKDHLPHSDRERDICHEVGHHDNSSVILYCLYSCLMISMCKFIIDPRVLIEISTPRGEFSMMKQFFTRRIMRSFHRTRL